MWCTQCCGEGVVRGFTSSPCSLVKLLQVPQELSGSCTGSIMQLSAEAVLGVCGTVQRDTSRHLLHSGYWHTKELKQLSGGRGMKDEERE